MLFNSLTFVVFFVVVLAAYWTMRSWEARKNLLLVASYIFYGAWNPPFAALLFATTALDFYLGRKMGKAADPGERRLWLVISVAVNLSMLGFFKYGNFLLENFQWLLARGGIVYQPPHLDVFLPIGISFYTFHSLSYTLDIYRGVMRPTRSLRDFTLAVSFFPQLVAGPIVRAGDFLPQLAAPPKPQNGRFLWGLALMTLGLFEKVVLADTMLVRLGRSRLRPWRTTRRARFLDRRDRVRGTNLFRLRRLLDLRHWRRALSRVPSQGQLPVPLRRSRVLRFLAALAYLALHVSARLPLHSARRKPARRCPRDGESDHRDVHRRALAWRGLDFVVWGLLHGSYLAIERLLRVFFERSSLGKSSRVQAGGRRDHLRGGAGRVGVFSCLRFRHRQPAAELDVWRSSSRRRST